MAAAVLQLRRRNRWSSAAVWFFILFLLLGGACLSTLDGGQPAPHWFAAIVIALGVLGAATGLAARRESAPLRQVHPDVLARARAVAGPRWSFRIAYRALLWLGLALFLGFGVICVPWTVNGAGYLAGAGPTGTFTAKSYGYSCDDNGDCTQVTDGVVGSGAAAISYTWPDKVPLGSQFQVRLPVIQWAAAIPVHDDGEAAISLVVGLLGIFGFAVTVWFICRRAKRLWWPRYARERAA